MSEIKLNWPDKVPTTEYNKNFLQGMMDRMATSYYKYGSLEDEGPKQKIDYMATLKERLKKYEEDGNTEWLIDVANWCMIEFTYPRHENAHFKSTDSDESPGRKWRGDHSFNKTRRNEEF